MRAPAGSRRAAAAASLLLAAGLACAPPPPDHAEVEQHVYYMERALESIARHGLETRWASFLGGAGPRSAVRGAGLPYFDYENYAAWRGRVADPVLGRKVELIYPHALRAQVLADPEVQRLAERIVGRLLGAERCLDGREASDAELRQVARFDPDRGHREAAYRERYSRPGAEVVKDLARLIRRRTAVARDLGFRDFYQLEIDAQGLDPRLVDRLLGDLERRSRGPAEARARKLAAALPGGVVRPWDVDGSAEEVAREVERYLDAEALLDRAHATFRALGLPLEERRLVIDAAPAPGRSQHFFAFPVSPPADVRVLLTPASGFFAHRATFHELGHALYYSEPRTDGFLLGSPPGRCLSEAVGKTFERLPYEPDWLVAYAGVPASLAAAVRGYSAADELARVRYFLAGHTFERRAYENPEQDLVQLYRDVARDVGFVDHGDDASAFAAVIHYTTQPLANLEYLVARLVQAQVYATMRQRFGRIIDNPEAGAYLRRTLLEPGGRLDLAGTVRLATGRDLTADDYVTGELALGD